MKWILLCVFIFPFRQATGQFIFGEATEKIDEIHLEHDTVFYQTIVDDEEGINHYEVLNGWLKGDSMRNDRRGYAARGWIEDFYPTGQMLHRGFYVDGQLKIYKNFYPNGQLERSFQTIDNYRSSHVKHYPDGTIRAKVEYRDGNPFRIEEFFTNGKLKYLEEFVKTMDHYFVKKSFYENGQLETTLELTNREKKLYDFKEYYESSVLKEEGIMAYSEIAFDYIKLGKWKIYDEGGKLVREDTYLGGKLDKSKDY